MNQIAVCPGVISSDVSGTLHCSQGWLVQAMPAPFDLSQIDPSVATAMFVAGFSLHIVPWAAAFGARYILKLLRS